ncbi:MAG: hypothetical protein HN341_15825 [Verrucomicrobia bacterium]|nr:hypothetical protein [Verrucomicrobiota bacterium]
MLSGCAVLPGGSGSVSFRNDLSFLEKHLDVVVLSDEASEAQVAVVPSLQGRVMTSTAKGGGGDSYGWINRELIASGKPLEHINAYGGEDRFWIGPEGGQFSVFFAKGVPFDLEHWFTPASIDTEPFDVVSQDRCTLTLTKEMQLKNYSGSSFDLRVDRDVRVLQAVEIAAALGVEPMPAVKMVGFETRNVMVNTGTRPWRKETGLLSIWILGMFNPSPETTVVVPFVAGEEAALGPIVNDAYFGKVPEERLIAGDGVLFFSGDGQYRSKIGLSPMRAKSVLGSYDASRKMLTIVQYNKPSSARDYVNSMWEMQDEPYRGDVVNSYNDGPPAPEEEPLGPFYELETSSPAVSLGVGGSITHMHRTMHLTGPETALDPIARRLLGVGIDDITSAMQ